MRLLPALLVLFALGGLPVTTAVAQDASKSAAPASPAPAAAAPRTEPPEAEAPQPEPAKADALPEPKPASGATPPPTTAAQLKGEKRIAFVIGNESYAAGALPTAANDAGLVAQTLQAAGFEVVGARDLDAETLRQSYADFLKRVTAAGPDTVAFVYMAGYGLQYGSDNYYVPIGADVSQAADIPIETIRVSDLTGPLVALKLEARFLVFDAAYQLPFTVKGPPLAGGFNLQDATPGSLVAYNAAPGTVAPVGKGNYGVFAQSLSAGLRDGGLTPDEVFDRVRLRVNEQTKGAEIPWDASKIDVDFRFFIRGKGAPPPAATPEQVASLTTKPIGELPVKQAYTAAVARDSYESYQSFVTSYGKDPLAKRARVLLAARREALTWRHTVSIDTPPAFWSYLGRYPHGPHATDARLRLAALTAPPTPPADFQAIAYDVPPPPPGELPFVDRPVIQFDEPGYDLPPLPPPPDYWLPPLPIGFVDLPPPPPPEGLFFLPVPAFVPLPVFYDPPPFVLFPFDNYFYGGFEGGGFGSGFGGYRENVFINDTRVVNNIHDSFPGGGPRGFGRAGTAAAAGGAAGAAAVALPAAARARAGALERRGITTPGQLNAARRQPGGLRGANGAAERNGLPGGRAGEAGRAGKAGAAGARPGEAARAAGRTGEPGDAKRDAKGADRGKAGAARGARSRAAGGRDAAGRGDRAGTRTQQRQAQRGRTGGRGAEARQARAPRRGRVGAAAGRQATRGAVGRAGRAGGLAASRGRGLAGGRGAGFDGGRAAQRFGGVRPQGLAAGRVGGFGGGRPGGAGLEGGRPGGFARPAAGGFGGGRPGGFGGGGFGGGRPGGGFGGGRPGGFGGGGGFRGGGFGGGGGFRGGGFGGGGGFHGGGGGFHGGGGHR